MMPPLAQRLELDLTVEHGGHRAKIAGEQGNFLAVFPTLSSLCHFAVAAWPLRHDRPAGITLRVQWRGLRWEVPHAARR
ncbi:MAG: hypothetical protein K2X03_18785 [Bryobacteraceae bacterium]|nr:hypothetical protein [Bryobacteraceae bacterium]